MTGTGMIRSAQGAAWLPGDFGAVLDTVVQEKAVAARSASIVSTELQKVSFPTWVADPAVAWYNELDSIVEQDGDSDEVVVIPSKTAGLTVASNELLNDSHPSVYAQIAHGLANQIIAAIDTAFLSLTSISKAPTSIGTLAYSHVDTGAVGSLASLDLIFDSIALAISHAAKPNLILMNPTIATQLSKIKALSGGQSNVLGPLGIGDGTPIAGLPVLVTPHVDAATAWWVLDTTQIKYVARQGTLVQLFPNVAQDAQYVRAVCRVGLGYLNPAAIVRGYDAP